MKKKWLLSAILLILFFVISMAAGTNGKVPLQPENLYDIQRVSDPQVSPCGNWIAYTISTTDLEKNSSDSNIWLYHFADGKSKQLTNNPKGDHSPRWSPNGKEIAFISSRDGVSNLYLLEVKTGAVRKLTSSETGLFEPIWSRDGKFILCTSRVLPKDKKNLENWTKKELPECQARTIDHLLFRQWDSWLGDERNHLFLVNCTDGSMKDITPGDRDVPPVSLSGSHDFDLAPDGQEACFTRNDAPMKAISTNHDLFLLDLESGKETKITSNLALDASPFYSPNDRFIAYTAMSKPAYESDRACLVLYDRKTHQHKRLTDSLDRSVRDILWHPSSKLIYFTCRELGRSSIYRVDLKGNITPIITGDGYNISLSLTPKGDRLVFLRSYNHQPYEIFSIDIKKIKHQAKQQPAKQLTFANADFLSKYELPKLEDFWFEGAGGTKVHGFIQKPPAFKLGKKYPAVLTIHGGPQNMWADRFMTNWFTFQMISSPGYVGIFIDPRGSSGYGSQFREEVSKDYGGRCYTDLMKGMDYVLENYNFIDKDKLAAIGGSFGGYSVNWIMGHNQRFKCLVSHAGLYNLVSFYGATEELWYPAWDMGETPWDEPEVYAKWSPHLHAKNFKTPTLVTHGGSDYRVPLGESLQLFTALQRQHVPSRLVIFPGEGHVITGPQDNVRWWKEIHRWFAQYLK